MDEHHLQIGRHGGYRTRPIPGILRHVLDHDLLETHGIGDGVQERSPVVAFGQVLPAFCGFLVSAFVTGWRAHVAFDGTFDVPSDEPLAYKVGYGPHDSESLDTEIVGEPFVGLYVGRDLADDRCDLVGRSAAAGDPDPESVAYKVPDTYVPPGSVDVREFHILQLDLLQLGWRAFERHELCGDGPFVLRSGESDPFAGHAHLAGEKTDHAVRFPVGGFDGGDGVFPVLRSLRTFGYLFHHEILGPRLETASCAVGSAEVVQHADVLLGRRTLPEGHLFTRRWMRSIPRRLRMPSSGLPRGFRCGP